jgi:hypothetical protein
VSQPSDRKCLRCDAPLEEVQPSAWYFRWWRCPNCYMGFHLAHGVLTEGKRLRE